MKKYTKLSLFCLVMFVYSTQAHANAGVPMLFLVWPLLLATFVPIVLIESYIFVKLSGISYWRAIKTTIVANLFSTFIGVPLTWGLLVGVQLLVGGGGFFKVSGFWQLFLGVTVQSPWLLPYEKELYWMIPTACLVLFIPFFFVSAWSEGLIMAKFLKEHEKNKVKKVTWKANLASYTFLYGIVFGILIFEIMRH